MIEKEAGRKGVQREVKGNKKGSGKEVNRKIIGWEVEEERQRKTVLEKEIKKGKEKYPRSKKSDIIGKPDKELWTNICGKDNIFFSFLIMYSSKTRETKTFLSGVNEYRKNNDGHTKK